MISHVIFDVDGTLVDSVDFHAEAWQKALEKFGKKVEVKEVRDQIGKGSDQLMPVFLSAAEIDEFGDELGKYRDELFKKDYLPRVQPFTEARLLFARLIADGKKIALASSAKSEELEKYKEIIGVEHLLEAETDADDVEHSKPEPDIFLAALKKLGNPSPECVVVVGDSPYDAIAAGKINLRTIGLLSGGFDEEWLKREGCVEVYKNPADLLDNYEKSLFCGGKPETAQLSDVVGTIMSSVFLMSF